MASTATIKIWRIACFVLASAVSLALACAISSNAKGIIESHLFYCAATLILGIAWISTGRSPFVLIAVGLLHIETTRIQLLVSLTEAAKHFRDEYGSRNWNVKAEVLSQQINTVPVGRTVPNRPTAPVFDEVLPQGVRV